MQKWLLGYAFPRGLIWNARIDFSHETINCFYSALLLSVLTLTKVVSVNGTYVRTSQKDLSQISYLYRLNISVELFHSWRAVKRSNSTFHDGSSCQVVRYCWTFSMKRFYSGSRFIWFGSIINYIVMGRAFPVISIGTVMIREARALK